MSRTKSFAIFILIIIIAISLMQFQKYYSENQLSNCISQVLSQTGSQGIEIIAKDRGDKPILKGKLYLGEKEKLFVSIYKQCEVEEIQDFIEITSENTVFIESINIQIDYFNHLVNVKGTLKNQLAIDDLLESFNTAIRDNLTESNEEWTLSPNIIISRKVESIDFSIYVTLLFTAIDNIRATDITIENNQLILNGLVRNKEKEIETMDKIYQLFADELTIVNQLELVIKNNIEIEKIEIEPLPLPSLDNQ